MTETQSATFSIAPASRVRRRQLASGFVFTLAPIAFFAVFFAYPVSSIIGRGLLPRGHLDLSVFGEVLGDASLRQVAWFTLWQALLSTLLTIVIALPGAFALVRYDFPGRRLLHAAVVIPFALPTAVVGASFLALLGPTGPLGGLGIDHGLAPILLAHVFFNYAVVVRIVGGLWSQLDPRAEDAARTLGASRWRAWSTVTLPTLRPAIAAAGSIVFLFTFTSFGVVQILGDVRRTTLEVEIFRQTSDFLNLRVSATLALLQLLAVTTAILSFGWIEQRHHRPVQSRTLAEHARHPRRLSERCVLGANLGVMALLLGLPLLVLVARSFATSTGPGFGFYRALTSVQHGSTLFVAPIEAVRNSLVIAAATTVIAIAIGFSAALTITRSPWSRVGRAFDTLLMLPLGVSAVTVGFGFLIALDEPPLDLRTSPIILPIAHALIAVPFVIRILVPAMRSLDPRMREVAAVLGASPARVRTTIDVPIMLRTGLVAAGFAFAISLGEFGATSFLARPDIPTLPIVITRLLGQPGALNFGQAMAAGTILLLLTGSAILAFEHLGTRRSLRPQLRIRR